MLVFGIVASDMLVNVCNNIGLCDEIRHNIPYAIYLMKICNKLSVHVHVHVHVDVWTCVNFGCVCVCI